MMTYPSSYLTDLPRSTRNVPRRKQNSTVESVSMKFLSSNDHLVHDLQQLLRRRYGRFLRAFLLLLSFIERGKPRTQAIHHVHRLGKHVTQAGVALLGHPAYVSLILTGLTHHRRKSGVRCQCVRRSESPDLPYLGLDRHRHHVTYARDRLQQSDVLVRIRYVTMCRRSSMISDLFSLCRAMKRLLNDDPASAEGFAPRRASSACILFFSVENSAMSEERCRVRSRSALISFGGTYEEGTVSRSSAARPASPRRSYRSLRGQWSMP